LHIFHRGILVSLYGRLFAPAALLLALALTACGDPAEPATAAAPAEPAEALEPAPPVAPAPPKPTPRTKPSRPKATRAKPGLAPANPEDDFLPNVLVIEAEDGEAPGARRITEQKPDFPVVVAFASPADAPLSLVCKATLRRKATCWLWVRGRAQGAEAAACTVSLAAGGADPLKADIELPSGDWAWRLVPLAEGQGGCELQALPVQVTLSGRNVSIDKFLLARDGPDDYTPSGADP
jgi:hypothetical protein